jgi:nucleotide-binding universal stress UspA family protein
MGVHVLPSLRAADAPNVEAAQKALTSEVTRVGAAGAFEKLLVVEAENVEEALHQTCVRYETTGVIVGRRVGVSEGGLVRMGTVVRRLLRRLPAPVIVVPPDLDPAQLGAGPLVLGVRHPDAASSSALTFADDTARSMGRELVVVAAAPALRGSTAYLPTALISEQQRLRVVQAEQQLEQWLALSDVSATLKVTLGGPAEQILANAGALGAPMVVCCRNKSGALQRYLGGTVSTELATFSRVPVVVVAELD